MLEHLRPPWKTNLGYRNHPFKISLDNNLRPSRKTIKVHLTNHFRPSGTTFKTILEINLEQPQTTIKLSMVILGNYKDNCDTATTPVTNQCFWSPKQINFV